VGGGGALRSMHSKQATLAKYLEVRVGEKLGWERSLQCMSESKKKLFYRGTLTLCSPFHIDLLSCSFTRESYMTFDP
jgi:hypothetical protein